MRVKMNVQRVGRQYLVAAVLATALTFVGSAGFAQVPGVVITSTANQTLVYSGSSYNTGTGSAYNGTAGQIVGDSRGDSIFIGMNKYGGSAYLAEQPAGGGAVVNLLTTLSAGIVGVRIDSSNNLYVVDGNQIYYVPFVNGAYPAVVDTTATSACTLPLTVNTAVCSYPFGTSNVGYYLSTIMDVAIDGSGNLYIVDAKDNNSGGAVLRIDEAPAATGVLTVLIDNLPLTATATGSGNNATFNVPGSLAVDAAGNIYYADGKQVTTWPAGYVSPSSYVPVTTGNPNPVEPTVGYTGGSVVGTGLKTPQGVTLDSVGNLYIADTGNGRVVEIPYLSGSRSTANQYTLNATVTAGATATQYAGISGGGLGVDGLGNIYYANNAGNSPYTASITIGYAAFGLQQRYYHPAVDTLSIGFNTSTSFASSYGGTLFSASGTPTCSTGTTYTAGQSCTIGIGDSPNLPGYQTGSLIATNSSGTVLGGAALYGGASNSSGLTFDPGTPSAIGTGWTAPSAVAVDLSGNAYVTDSTSGNLYKSVGGATQTLVASGFSHPSAVAIDTIGNLYVADTGEVVEVPLSNLNNGTYGTKKVLVTGLSGPSGLAVSYQGNLYVADSGNGRVLVLASSGGQPLGSITSTIVSGLGSPVSVAIDFSNNLFIGDNGSKSLIEVNASGIKTTLLSGITAAGGVAVDNIGSVFFVDKGAKTVTRIPNIGGALSTSARYLLIGGPVVSPSALAIDNVGRLYEVDATNAAVGLDDRTAGALPFGNVTIGATSPTLTSHIVNNGYANLTFSASSQQYPLGTAGTYSSEFNTLSSSTCPGTPNVSINNSVAPGDSCTANAVFAPTYSGASSWGVPMGSNASSANYNSNDNFTGTGATAATVGITGQASVVYGASSTYTASATPDGTYTVSITGTATSSASVNISGGTGTFLLPSLGTGSYTLSLTVGGNTGTLTVAVTQAPLTLTANNFSRIFDVANPSFTGSYSGFVNGDTASVVTGTPAFSTSATRVSPATTYTITAATGTATAANYTIAPASGTLTVTGSAPQKIFFAPLPNFTHGTAVTLTALSTSGLPITYTATGGTISGSVLTIGATGTVTVTATQAGNASYAVATSVARSFSAQ